MIADGVKPHGFNALLLTFDFECPECHVREVIVYGLHNENLDCFCAYCNHQWQESL